MESWQLLKKANKIIVQTLVEIEHLITRKAERWRMPNIFPIFHLFWTWIF